MRKNLKRLAVFALAAMLGLSSLGYPVHAEESDQQTYTGQTADSAEKSTFTEETETETEEEETETVIETEEEETETATEGETATQTEEGETETDTEEETVTETEEEETETATEEETATETEEGETETDTEEETVTEPEDESTETNIRMKRAGIRMMQVNLDDTESEWGADYDTATEFVISNADELLAFANLVNSGKNFSGKTVTLAKTIDASSITWVPIGNSSGRSFKGTFDGNNHQISGLSFTSTSSYVGLFGNSSGAIKNVQVTEASFTGYSYVGGICGKNSGTIENCTSDASVTGTSITGGICGENTGQVSSCTNTGTVTGASGYTGGICGQNGTSSKNEKIVIKDCNNYGTVTANKYAGGICGDNIHSSQIISCENYGAVRADNSGYVGGICAYNSSGGKIDSCTNNATVTGNQYVGGICGMVQTTTSSELSVVQYCVNNGDVSATAIAGGICGCNYGKNNYSSTIQYCYNTASVAAKNYYAGGICGYIYTSTSYLISCYSTAASVTPSRYSGGIGYSSSGGTNMVKGCFYLTEEDAPVPGGLNGVESFNAKGMTTAQFASGEVTYLLNERDQNTDIEWFQTIGTQKIPQFEGEIVYKADGYYCPGIKEQGISYGTVYTNTNTTEVIGEHIFDQEIAEEEYFKSAATCTEGAVYYKSCLCGEKGTETFVSGEALGHDYDEGVFIWSEDGKSCEVVFTCKNDSEHKVTENAAVTSQIKTAATCTQEGVTTYTATVLFEEKEYTETKDITDIAATGHDYDEGVFIWSEDGKSCEVVFTCKNDGNYKVTESAAVTSQIKTAATCTQEGVTTYTATVLFEGKEYTQTKDIADIAATGHSYEDGKCSVCGAIEPGSQTSNAGSGRETGNQETAGNNIQTENIADPAENLAAAENQTAAGNNVPTGDTNNLTLWGLLLALSALVLCYIALMKRRKAKK